MNSKSYLPMSAHIGWGSPVLTRFRDDFDALFEDMFNNIKTVVNIDDVKVFNESQAGPNYPKVNVSESDTGYSVDIAIAGIDKDKLSLEVKDNILYMSYDKVESSEQVEDKKYLRREIASRSFIRTIRFPKKVVSSDATASYKDGIVTFNISKEIIKEKESVKIVID